VIAGEDPLPEPWAGPLGPAGRVPADARWAAYFDWILAAAAATGSELLRRWADWELCLRNELTRCRAEQLGVEVDRALFLPGREVDPGDLLLAESAGSALRHAGDPLAAQEAVDRIRWRWVARHDPSYSGSDDELVAYAIRLTLVERWHHIAQRQAGGGAPMVGMSSGARA
jgi:hypothetical protein